MEVQVIEKKSRIVRSGARQIERMRIAAYCRVSTDSEEQINSYNSQLEHYTDYIASKPEWTLVDIYADEAITGTQTKKRDDFKRMINDAMNGEIDMIITKSISRFARNTLDTLRIVRGLKERNVAVLFEQENINTLTMNGELLLTILSSVAQQEVENTSDRVKMGLKMKMRRGEFVGFQGCLGYDYNTEDKTISINEEGAEIVRYIFNRYVEGVGCFVIAKELSNLGYKTPRGNTTWHDTVVRDIIRNEKYKGDILMGKTFTVDPIAHKRLSNKGESEQYYVEKHHEPIISEDLFDKAQEILNRRSESYKNPDVRRDRYSRQYTFSSRISCTFCGGLFTRRNWYSGTNHEKRVWQCVVATKKGKKYCPDSKGIDEKEIERAFVEAFALMCNDNQDIVAEFIQRIENTLNESSYTKELSAVEKTIVSLENRIENLVDLHITEAIDRAVYDKKYKELNEKLDKSREMREELSASLKNDIQLKKRLAEFKQVFEQNDLISEFDPSVFDSVVEKVLIGGIDEDGNKNPYKITFVFKTGYTCEGEHKARKKGRNKKAGDTDTANPTPVAEKKCSSIIDDTCGVRCRTQQEIDLPRKGGRRKEIRGFCRTAAALLFPRFCAETA